MNSHPLMGVPPGGSVTVGTSHPQQTNHTQTGSTSALVGLSPPQTSFSPPHIAYSPSHTQPFPVYSGQPHQTPIQFPHSTYQDTQGPPTVYYAPLPYSSHQGHLYHAPQTQNLQFVPSVSVHNRFSGLSVDYPPLPQEEEEDITNVVNPMEAEGISDLLKRNGKRSGSPLEQETSKTVKPPIVERFPEKFRARNNRIEAASEFISSESGTNLTVVFTSQVKLPSDRAITLELKKILQTEKFDFYSNYDRNRLSVYVQSQTALETLMKIQKLDVVDVAPEEKRQVSYGVIKQIALDYSKEELLTDLRVETNIEIKELKRLKRYNQETKKLEDSLSICVAFESNSLPQSIWLYGRKRSIERYNRPIIQCFKCQKYGHTQEKCRSPHAVCLRCANKHSSNECPLKLETKESGKYQKYVCANCGKNHSTTSGSCPARQQNREIIKIAVAQNIPMKRAANAYRSYADALNKKAVKEQPPLEPKNTLQQLVLFVSKVPEVIDIKELEMKDRIVKLCQLMHSLFKVEINVEEVWNLANKPE